MVRLDHGLARARVSRAPFLKSYPDVAQAYNNGIWLNFKYSNFGLKFQKYSKFRVR